MEDSEGESGQEVPRREEAGHGAKPEACARWDGERTEVSQVSQSHQRWSTGEITGNLLVEGQWQHRSYIVGSARRPPAVGCCPACSRSISPAGGRPGCVHGRRELGTGSSAPWTPCPMWPSPPLYTPLEGWLGHWDKDTTLGWAWRWLLCIYYGLLSGKNMMDPIYKTFLPYLSALHNYGDVRVGASWGFSLCSACE